MAIISTGNTFGPSETVTDTKLNNIANLATFDEPVDDSTLELHTDGKLRVKDSGITTSKIADSNVTFSKLTDVIDDDTMATASATTLATSESIKAYTDSIISSSALPGQSGGLSTEGEQGSYTLPGGLIVKYGTLNSNASIVTYTFATAFPTAIIGVNATVNESVSNAAETCSVPASSQSSFNLTGYQGTSGAAVGRVFWVAYGY